MNQSKLKIKLTFITFTLVFIGISIKALFVQVVDNEKLKELSRNQTIRSATTYPNRGSIFDRNGEPLAINNRTYNIFTIPKKFKETAEELKKLQKVYNGFNLTKITNSIKKRMRYTWIDRKIHLTEVQVKEIKKFKSIYIEKTNSRVYPNNELASQILGFVGVDNVGLGGIEFQFDKELRGEAKRIKYIMDAKGRPLRIETKGKTRTPKDLYLSIDKDIQDFAEMELKKKVEETNAQSGGFGVMDIETGEILAMANYPTFNPNKLKKGDARKLSFISDPFEPGSIFKILTIASALENKIVRPSTNYFCEYGRLKVGNHIIKEAETSKGFEWLSVAEIIKYSSNVGTTKISFDLSFPRLKTTLEKFNIGEKLGVELPGESRGIFTKKENVTPLTLSNIGFGQGVATTGLQMLASYAAIANGGVWVKPTIIKSKKEPEKHRVIDKDLAAELQQMLVDAVDSGTGNKAKISYYTIAGKTSTAQKVDEYGNYTHYISGFIGYPVGVKKPFVVFAYVDEPNWKSFYGGDIAAPLFKSIATYILYKNKEFSDLASAEEHVNNAVFDSIKLQNSAIRKFEANAVPNFVGLDKNTARVLAEKYNLRLKIKGFGIVEEQWPAPETRITDSREVHLTFETPDYE